MRKISALSKVLIFLFVLGSCLPSWAAWDKTKPVNNEKFTDSPALFRANWDAIELGTDSALQITNAKVAANAGIVDTKLATISTAGKVSGAALTSLASTPAGAGVLPFANGGTNAAGAAWTDYSTTSTTVGWSSISTKQIYTKKIGTTVFVAFYITGTSNSTSTTFTVPYASASVVVIQTGLSYAVDNSAALGYQPGIYLQNGLSAVGCFPAISNTGIGWTASGTKTVCGQFWYEAA